MSLSSLSYMQVSRVAKDDSDPLENEVNRQYHREDREVSNMRN